MVLIADERGDGAEEGKHHGDGQQRCEADHAQGGGVDALRVFTFLGHEAEEGGLHAIGEQDDEQRHIGIDVGNDAVFATRCGEACSLDGYEQIVDKSGDNAREAVDGRIFCQ